MTRATPAFSALVILSVLTSGGYVALARRNAPPELPLPATLSAAAAPRVAAIRARDHLVFRDMSAGPLHGMLAVAALDDLASRETTALACNRVYSAAATTACMAISQKAGRPNPVYLLDDGFTVRAQFDSPGAPSRVRLDRAGRTLALTAFTARDSYQAFGFATRTHLVDGRDGRLIADLEQYEVQRDGRPLRSVDFNYWGVTFANDARQIYATLSSQGQTYLVKGTVDARRLTVIRGGVECPSLSPDGGRIAFKRRIAPGQWEAAVYDLASGVEHILPGTRGLDDQLEWLDDEHVLYGLREQQRGRGPANVWIVRADGSTPAVLFLRDAESPSVVRRGSPGPV